MGKGLKQQYFIILAFIAVFVAGCGIKSPPIPPRTEVPKPVEDLTKEINNSTLTLTWTIPDMKKKDRYEGFLIFRSSTLRSKSGCTNCPKVFKKVAQIPVDSPKPDPEQGKISFQEALEEGYRYSYMVKGVTEKGGKSPDSNIVAFDF